MHARRRGEESFSGLPPLMVSIYRVQEEELNERYISCIYLIERRRLILVYYVMRRVPEAVWYKMDERMISFSCA